MYPPCRVHQPLGLTRRARRVEDEERVLRAALHRRARVARARHHVVPPHVAPRRHRQRRARVPKHQHVLDPVLALERRVDHRLQRDGLAAAPPLVLRDDHDRAAVAHPVAHRLSRESAEDDRVDRPQPRARQHRDRRLGDHPHIDDDALALVDAQRPQRVRRPAHLAVQLAVRDAPPLPGLVGLPQDRGLVPARLQVLVQAGLGHVEPPVAKPRQRPVADLVEVAALPLGRRPHPAHTLARHAQPEAVGIIERRSVGLTVGRAVGDRARRVHRRAQRDGVGLGHDGTPGRRPPEITRIPRGSRPPAAVAVAVAKSDLLSAPYGPAITASRKLWYISAEPPSGRWTSPRPRSTRISPPG